MTREEAEEEGESQLGVKCLRRDIKQTLKLKINSRGRKPRIYPQKSVLRPS